MKKIRYNNIKKIYVNFEKLIKKLRNINKISFIKKLKLFIFKYKNVKFVILIININDIETV